MKVVVCVKQVKDELNPFDSCAVECALRMENVEVTVISMGRPEVGDTLLRLTRLGVKRAVLLTDPAFAGADTLATGYALSLAMQKLQPDLILCGRQSIDGDTAQVGPCLASLLGWPVITNVMEIQKADADGIECFTRLGEEQTALPAVLTVERINTLRFPRLRAKTGTLETWSAADLGAERERCGLAGSPTRVLKVYESNVGRRSCQWISPQELPEILECEQKKERLTVPKSDSGSKLPEVWIVGEEPRAMAETVAEKIRVIPKGTPEELTERIRAEKPEVVLWDSGLWGRRTAPQVAAKLQTGLCADCTMLETDGKELFMYRPAGGGSIMAKIRCLTRPQMATVRTAEEESSPVMLAVGLGALSLREEIAGIAEAKGYELCASRAVVDKGEAPYEQQIGLTGRTVSPKVYVALGVSGAVQHTCGIEQSGCVIAVNPDKNARIFDYADYGICGNVEDVLKYLR